MMKTKILEHEVFVEANHDVTKYLEKCDLKNKIMASQSKVDTYAIETFRYLMSISKCIEQLNWAIEMLAGYRTSNEVPGLTRIDYISYGLENIYLRITTVFDRCLRLVNVVYQLGLPERECKRTTIIKNINVKNTNTGKSLKELDSYVERYQGVRNVIAHSMPYTGDEEFGTIEILTLGKPEKSSKQYDALLVRKTNEYIKTKKENFKKEIEKIEKIVINLFNAIGPEYTIRKNKMV